MEQTFNLHEFLNTTYNSPPCWKYDSNRCYSRTVHPQVKADGEQLEQGQYTTVVVHMESYYGPFGADRTRRHCRYLYR